MNKRNHVANALLLSLGVSVLLTRPHPAAAVGAAIVVGPPIVLGALIPDLDTAFGQHRKTFHNVWVLGLAVAFPALVGNLHYVWLGITTHYVLGLLGNQYGMGILYPLSGFYGVPVGVNVDSRWADLVTLVVTAVELGVVFLLVEAGLGAQLAPPELPVSLSAAVALTLS